MVSGSISCMCFGRKNLENMNTHKTLFVFIKNILEGAMNESLGNKVTLFADLEHKKINFTKICLLVNLLISTSAKKVALKTPNLLNCPL